MADQKTVRGRPRDPRLRKKILAAAAALLNEGGITAVTMEAVAAKAGVGKPTLYREWPNAASVAMSAFLETTRPQPQKKRKGRALDALRDQLHAIAKGFATRTGRNTAMMIAAAQNDSELAKVFRNQFIMGRREEGRVILARAIAARELRDDLDVEAALDLIYAPLYFRLLIGHGPLDAAFTDTILDSALKGLGAIPGKVPGGKTA
jgi:AcrR family transcriptional regulator